MSDARAGVAGVPSWARFWNREYSGGGHPLTQLFSQRLGAAIAYVAWRCGLSPSAVTAGGGILALAASIGYAVLPAGWQSQFALAIAYQLAYGFDCADGQLARATKRASEFGAWFDVAVDFVRYLAIGLALLVWLAQRHAMDLDLAVAVSGTFMVGVVVSLHTSISLQRQSARQDPAARPQPSPLRAALRTVIDTPFLLLALCLLRDLPQLLSIYVVLTGIGYTLVAVVLASRRLRR